LKRDFSNLNEVLEIMKDDNKRNQIVEQAYQDIVLSNKYSYQHLVNFVIDKSLSIRTVPRKKSIKSTLVYWYCQIPPTTRRKIDDTIYAIESFLLKTLRK
jgi:hypothetical protein